MKGISGRIIDRQFQCRNAVEGGKGIIGQDQVKTILLQRSQEISPRFHAGHLTGNTLCLELGLNELCVLRIVFKVQNA